MCVGARALWSVHVQYGANSQLMKPIAVTRQMKHTLDQMFVFATLTATRFEEDRRSSDGPKLVLPSSNFTSSDLIQPTERSEGFFFKEKSG